MIKYQSCLINKALLVIVIISLAKSLDAQIITNIWVDAGKTNVSEGLFFRGAITGEYRFAKNSFAIGGQSDMASHNDKGNPAFKINYSRSFKVKSFIADATPFALYRRFSESMYEMNYGLVFKSAYRKFVFSLGTNFRTYNLTSRAKEKFDIEEPGKISENFNAMYSLTWHILPLTHHWNIAFTGCNFDHFNINQETNPLFNLRFSHRMSQSGILYAELWYRSAGALNQSVNTFGYFFRTGIKWEIKR